MNKRIFSLCCAIFAITIVAASLYASTKKFEISIDKSKVAIGEKAQLGISFYGTQSMPAPDVGNISGLDIRYVGPSTMMTVINGQVSTSITHLYSVQPLKTGKFQIGPFSFKYKSENYKSNIVFLEVSEEKAPAPLPQQRTRTTVSNEPLDLGDRMFLTLYADKTVAYVNELIPVTVKLYVNRLNVNDIQLPTFAQENFSKVEFREPKQFRERLNGLLYDVLEFKTSIFGTKPGDYRLGPAKIKCNVMVRKSIGRGPGFGDDFFGPDPRDSFFDDFLTRYERHPTELKSKDIQIGVLPLPDQGRPRDFKGAVGDYQFIYTANPTKVKVGDPITLKMDINGTGNFNTVLIPELESTRGFKIYEAQVKTEENRKSFTQVLIPESDKVSQAPRAIFSYFDPKARKYITIDQGPIAITVEKPIDVGPAQIIGPTQGALLDRAPSEDLTRDIIYIKETPGQWARKGRALCTNAAFWSLFVIPLIALIALYLYTAKQNRIKSDSAYARRLAAFKSSKSGLKELRKKLKTGNSKAFYESLFNTLQDYLGYRLSIPSAGITSNIIEEALLSKEIDPDIIGKVRKLFKDCDEARFAFEGSDSYKMKDNTKELEEIVRYFERRRI